MVVVLDRVGMSGWVVVRAGLWVVVRVLVRLSGWVVVLIREWILVLIRVGSSGCQMRGDWRYPARSGLRSDLVHTAQGGAPSQR